MKCPIELLNPERKKKKRRNPYKKNYRKKILKTS